MRKYNEIPDDEVLIDMFFQRTEDAIIHTKKKYGSMCCGIIYRILGNWHDTEECENDIYLRIWNSVPPERPNSMKAYLARIARNLALNRYRYNTADCRNSALEEAFEELEAFLPTCGTNPDTVVETEHFKQVVNDFLRKQSRDARIFFIRRYWYGEKTSEIAKDCSVSEAKVKTSLFRTRQYFGEVLRKEGIEV